MGPETLSAATTMPPASRTGAATAQRPGSSSSTAVALVEHLDGSRGRDAEVRRLAADPGEALESAPGELDEIVPRGLPAGVAQQHGPGLDGPASRIALDEPLALERPDETRRRALRQTGELGELPHGRRFAFLDDVHEQLGAALDRLGSGVHGHGSSDSHDVERSFHTVSLNVIGRRDKRPGTCGSRERRLYGGLRIPGAEVVAREPDRGEWTGEPLL